MTNHEPKHPPADMAGLDGLIERLRECNGIGSFDKRGDRVVVLTFDSHDAGNKVFEILGDMIADARGDHGQIGEV